MIHRTPRARWNWILLATVIVALAGAWLSAEAEARNATTIGGSGGTIGPWKSPTAVRR